MPFKLESSVTLLQEKITSWFEIVVKMLPNLIIALVVIALFIFSAKLVRKIVKRVIPKVTRNKSIIELVHTLAYLAVILIGAFIALEILNLEKTVTSLLAGAGVLGLALGFAFQEIASNFVSGVFIAIQEPYKIGDIVEIEDYVGEVTKIEIRTTSITTFQGLEVVIPNKEMFTKPFTNYTSTPNRRVDVSVGVSYGDNLEKVEKITKETLGKIEQILPNTDVEVFFQEFGASSINLTARFWVEYPGNKAYLKAKHHAIMELKKAFDKEGVSIPFPIRTLDFGIKGGATLKEMMASDQAEKESN